MNDDYPGLEKTLIEIEEDIKEDEEQDILPLIDFEISIKKKESNISVENIYSKIRKRLISVIRRKNS